MSKSLIPYNPINHDQKPETFGSIISHWLPRIIICLGALYLFGYTTGGTAAEYIKNYQGTGGGVYKSAPDHGETNGGKSEDRLSFGEKSKEHRGNAANTVKLIKEDRRGGEQSGGINVAYAESEDDGKADINALAMAVSYAETGGCKTGTAISFNNCVGIRINGKFVRYETTDKSLDDFKVRWSRSYGGRFPTYKDAVLWTGNDRPDTWLGLVKEEYQRRIEAKDN